MNTNKKEKDLEDFRVYSQKMELLVSLANDVAHSFNDILQTIKSNLELAIVDTKETDKSYSYLVEAYETTKQGSDLTSRLEILGKKFEPDVQTIDLKKELQRIKPILRRNLPERINLEINITENISPIVIDPFQLEQLFLHLALNACDAVIDEGTFSIDIENTGTCVKIEISDDGIGMDDDIKDYIFEPFFTTKAIDSTRMGLSAGLGLYIVERIIIDNNGSIKVHSKLNEGTTFTVHLPAKKNNGIKYDENEKQLTVGNETILIIEDNDGVRNICRKALERFGYNVISASTGEYGIKTFITEKIDMVLIDLVLPNETGISVLESIRKFNKNIKCVLMSGYDISEVTRNRVNAEGYLHKPFAIKDLLQIIREALD